LLEVTGPSLELEKIPGMLSDFHVAQVWTSRLEDDSGLVRILLDARDTEALSDILVRHFESRKDFRLILLPVEATVPPVEEPSKNEIPSGREAEAESEKPQRISREELYEDLAEASRLTPVYIVMVALSTVVAAIGLIRGDVAIVIGAMVIAPLLGPVVALSLACTLGDLQLVKRSLKAIGAGMAIAAALSLLLGIVLTVDQSAPGIASRTQPGIGDLILALAAGAAGSLAFTSGVPTVVVGVMVAVALLPPLVVGGLLAGAGFGTPAAGAFALLLTNVTCVNLAAVATFLIQKVRPRTWWEEDRARRATRRAVATWIIMLVVLIVLTFLRHVGLL
jgi:uncharacterized hydrophobic protein (TIGR00341 family)